MKFIVLPTLLLCTIAWTAFLQAAPDPQPSAIRREKWRRSGGETTTPDPFFDPMVELEEVLEKLNAKIDGLKDTVKDLARQTMLQQLFVEERIRSEGDSGVKMVRGSLKGPANYYGSTHIGKGAFDAIHDHSNYDRTVGMGEIIAVLNGVEFRTRHNDYKLKMPSTVSTEYHATEGVPFPGVPEAVTSKATVDEQIEELRLWFKAFKDQDYSVRDYRDYFKAVLCYLEGAWTLDKELEEPFESDRHQIDASSWFELQELVRFASYTGTKSRLENFAYLPTTIMSVNDTTGLPNYAQWNYRIVCHPTGVDVPLSYLKQQEDFAYRYPRQKETDDVTYSRAARFHFYEHDNPEFTRYGLLDQIFYTIPGKDNIPDNLTQNSFGEVMYEVGSQDKALLNTGYYHRWFQFSKPGAMGLTRVARGFNDANMWVAQTTQKRVAPMGLQVCSKVKVPDRRRKKKVCEIMYNRFSYAIPLEIIYMTPLLSWNPYNLAIHEKGGIVTKDGRTGAKSVEKAYNGTSSSHYYLTPVEFFEGRTDQSDPADTVRNARWVLDQSGVPRKTTASGTRIMLQSIEGVGKVRLRYPIAPVHGEGSSVWKELNALRDSVLEERRAEQTDKLPTVVHFEMSTTLKDPPGEHSHEFTISYADYRRMLDEGAELSVTTTEMQGHIHDLTIKWNKRKDRFVYTKCGSQTTCWDEHPHKLILETQNAFNNMVLP